MLKKTITYKDLDGNDVTEEFYFNLSKAELAEMELSHKGGFADWLRSIIETDDRYEIIQTFKKIISATVGRRSEDGKRFIKSQEITDEFMQTDAYSVLFMELIQNNEIAAAFINGVMPNDLAQKLTEVELPALPTRKKLEDYTENELLEMSNEEISMLMTKIKGGNIPKALLLEALKRK